MDDSLWHVTDYYENIRNKVKNLDKSLGKCYDVEGNLPARVCNTPLKVGGKIYVLVCFEAFLFLFETS